MYNPKYLKPCQVFVSAQWIGSTFHCSDIQRSSEPVMDIFDGLDVEKVLEDVRFRRFKLCLRKLPLDAVCDVKNACTDAYRPMKHHTGGVGTIDIHGTYVDLEPQQCWML